MEHSVETVSPVQRKITVSVPAADVDRAIDKAVRRFGADLILPGFRKGKVPAKVLEKRFGNEIYARATDTLVNEAIAEILDKEKLHPMSRIQFEGEGSQAARGKDFSFGFSFEVLSDDIKLPEIFPLWKLTWKTPKCCPPSWMKSPAGCSVPWRIWKM